MRFLLVFFLTGTRPHVLPTPPTPKGPSKPLGEIYIFCLSLFANVLKKILRFFPILVIAKVSTYEVDTKKKKNPKPRFSKCMLHYFDQVLKHRYVPRGQ